MPPHIVGASGVRYPAHTVAALDVSLSKLAAQLRSTQPIAPTRRRTIQADIDQLLEARTRLQLQRV